MKKVARDNFDGSLVPSALRLAAARICSKCSRQRPARVSRLVWWAFGYPRDAIPLLFECGRPVNPGLTAVRFSNLQLAPDQGFEP
jgi:hypothetical protein